MRYSLYGHGIPDGRGRQVTHPNELDVVGEARIHRALRHFWHVVAYADDLREEPVPFTLCGQDIVICRLDGEVVAFNDLCAHRGTRLSLGRVHGGGELECPYHGWRYDKSGACVLAPQRPDLAARLRARVRRYPTAERFGLIWVSLLDEPHFDLPDYPAWDDPAYHHVMVPSTDWACSAARRVENYTDYSHLAIVHPGYLADRDEPEVPAHEVWREDSRLECRQDPDSWIRVPTKPGEAVGGKQPRADGYTRYRSDWRVFMPLTVALTVIFEDGGIYELLFHPTPIGPKQIRNFTVAGRNFGEPEKARAEVADFESLIYGQDKDVVESQRPEELPEDLSVEMHLRGVDSFSVEYRRWLISLAKDLDELPDS